MNRTNRPIKYVALGLAILLCAGILTAIISLVLGLLGGFSAVGRFFHFGGDNVNLVSNTATYSNVRNLDLDNGIGTLILQTGDTDVVTVELSDVPEGIVFRQEGSTLRLRDENNFIFNFDSIGRDSKITITLPKGVALDTVKIDNGVGNMRIEDAITAEEFDLDAGTGNITIDGLTSNRRSKVNGGVGNIRMQAVQLKDLDLDCGVGSVSIDGVVTGRSRVSCGVGSTDLNLRGNIEEYDLTFSGGLGAIHLNGDKVDSDYHRTGSSSTNSIDVDGGVGKITLNMDK